MPPRGFDLAYRPGGEEFLVLLPGADPAQVEPIAEKLRQVVAAEPAGGGTKRTGRNRVCGGAASPAQAA